MKEQTPNISPYQTDPDNINHRHHVNYQIYQDLFDNLPAGWIRIPTTELQAGQAPYVHTDGRTSFRNPNSDKIMELANATKQADRGGVVDSTNTKVKKLRLLLAAGAPLGAVEQKAKLDGVDMKLVLSPSSKATAGNDDGSQKSESKAIPDTLLKKYKRMIKAGVPMDRVQQLAGIEAGVSPKDVERSLGHTKNNTTTSSSSDEKCDKEKKEEVDPCFLKFVRMHRAGIPLVAIQNSARIQGLDVDELNKALDLSKADAIVNMKQDRNAVEAAAMQNVVDELNNELIGVEDERDDKSAVGDATDTNEEETNTHFTPTGASVSFPIGRGRPLTDLVRKMAQTVQKTARFGGASSGKQMVVDKQTLYHAFGAFKGVQFARDEYNSTFEKTMDIELIHAKRHAFVEMTRSIGMVMLYEDQLVDIPGLDDLISYIDSSNKQHIDRASSLLKDGYYDFDSLQSMYIPGSFVIAKHAGGGGVDSMCQVVWNRYTQGKTIFGKPMKYFELCVRFIVPVGGGKATFAEVVEGMEMFEGTRSLLASAGGAAVGLSFVPVFDDELGNAVERYQQRGELYNRIVTSSDQRSGKIYVYMKYEKGCFYAKHGNGGFNSIKPSAALATGGRIIVDFDAAIENGHFLSVGRDDMVDGIRLKLKEYKTNQHTTAEKKENNGAAVNASDMILLSGIPEEYFALTWPTMSGFSLTSKSWGDVIIDGLNDITFDPEVFDRLVLSDSRKRIIKALVKHTHMGGGFQDLIKGKGEGTVFLLHGLPGTGKTLTAEALAEFLRRPLYSISMGTLGTTADELERRLGEILQLSERWNALLLLDEADSFLEARSSNASIERNAMVSVMLRLVEYHQGIMFLTSNRIDSLDPAFKTRITLALNYEPLDCTGRAKVWENLLVRSGYNDMLGAFDLKALSSWPLNGREIKNALRIAMALAADDDCIMSQHLLMDSAATVNGHNKTINCSWDDQKVKHRRWNWKVFKKH